MDLLTDAEIRLVYTDRGPGMGADLKKTLLGTSQNITMALVFAMEELPDFYGLMKAAVTTYEIHKKIK